MQTNPTILDPASELFHFFISYRVAHQAEFSLKLHDRLYHKASNTPIPLVEFAKWPCSRFPYRRHSSALNKCAHVFLDSRCLSDGDPWRDGFIEALRISVVFVPLLSYSKTVVSLRDRRVNYFEGEIASLRSKISRMIDADNTQELDSANAELAAAQMQLLQAQSRADDTQVEHTGSVGDFVSQNPKSARLGVDSVDNYLLELILAKELHRISSASSNSSLCACAVILPVIIGDFANAELTDTVCSATNLEAVKLLERLGLQASPDVLT
jgi:hypothetical protein